MTAPRLKDMPRSRIARMIRFRIIPELQVRCFESRGALRAYAQSVLEYAAEQDMSQHDGGTLADALNDVVDARSVSIRSMSTICAAFARLGTEDT